MPIPFICPHCGKQTTVSDEFAGQTGPCSACGQKITIPTAGMRGKSSGSSAGVIALIVAVVGVGLIFVIGILVALLLPAVQAARTAARRAQSSNNLKQIGLALHNYHDTYNTFPPAYIANDDGTKRTSWRAMVLPFVEQSPLYDQYDFNVNWDHPNNGNVRSQMLAVYRSPNAIPTVPTETNYVLLTGKGTAFDGQNAAQMRQMLDGTSNIVVAIEVNNLGVEWAEPRDVDISELPKLLKEGAIGAGPGGTVNVLMADGSVQMLPANTDFSSMARIADGK